MCSTKQHAHFASNTGQWLIVTLASGFAECILGMHEIEVYAIHILMQDYTWGGRHVNPTSLPESIRSLA